MKKGFVFFKKSFLILSVFLTMIASGLSLVFASENKNTNISNCFDQNFEYNQQIENLATAVNFSNTFVQQQSEDQTTVYNFLTPVYFADEYDSLNLTVSGTGKTCLQILEEMYNSQTNYSVNKYYKTVSNGKLNLVTIFLLDENDGAVQLSYRRTQCVNKDYNTSDGYNENDTYMGYVPYTTYMEYVILDEVCSVAIETIKKDYNTTCDFDGDGLIDSFSIILLPDQNDLIVDWSDLLWPHSADMSQGETIASALGLNTNSFKYINDNGKKIKFGNYAMQDLEISINSRTGMFEINTPVHELGHVLGFPDYYIYDNLGTTSNSSVHPVGNWDIMAYSHLDSPQYPLSYNRYKQNWLTDQNIVQITKNGTYKIKPVNYEETNNVTLGNRTVAYKICSDEYPDQAIWLEYRKQSDDSFENNGYFSKDGLLIYRVDEGFYPTAGYSNMLSAGNFSAVPYNVYVFRNETTAFKNALSKNNYAPLNMENKSMGDGKSYTVSAVEANCASSNGFVVQSDITLTATNITWQKYSAKKNQNQYSADEVTEENSGIVISVVSIDQETGELEFSVYCDKLADASESDEISSQDFEDINLYNSLLKIAGKSEGDVLSSNQFENTTSLDLYNLTLTSLDGLQLFDLSNVQSIDVSLNNLFEYSQIQTLASLYPNITFNLAFNDFDLSVLPENLKTSNFVWGYQKMASLTSGIVFLDKTENYVSKYFYKTENTDVYFDISTNGLTQVKFVPNEYQIFLKNNTDTFCHDLQFDVKVVKVYLSSDNGTLERNCVFPWVEIEGMQKDLFEIVQTPQTFDTSVVTNGFVQVDWIVKLKSDPTQTYQLPTMYFEVKDTTPPIVTVLGAEKIEVVSGQSLNIPSDEISISDNGENVDFQFVENPIQSDKGYWTKQYVKIENESEVAVLQIDTTTYGNYKIKYWAVDNFGNISDVVVREIEITSVPIEKSQFEDENLYNAVLNLGAKLNVYQNSLAAFDTIDFSNKNISSLKGLELLTFKSGVNIDLSQNGLSNFDDLQNLLSLHSNINLINLHFNNFDWDEYQQFSYKQKTTFGIQGTKLLSYYIQNGNAGQYLQFFAFEKDDKFQYTSTYKPENGQNTIQIFGKYNIKIDFDGVFDNIEKDFCFGSIEFAQSQQTLEVFESFNTNLIVQGIDINQLDLVYFVDNKRVEKTDLAINQTIGTKQLDIKIYYDGDLLKTASKTFVICDLQAPTIAFEEADNVVYLKKGQTPNFQFVASDNYDDMSDLQIDIQNDFVPNTCGIFCFSVFATDTSGNISKTISKVVHVGNVQNKSEVVIEYNSNISILDVFEFEYFTVDQFSVNITKNVVTSTLGSQVFKATLTHQSGLVFEMENSLEIKDLTPPQIWLEGESEVEIYIGSLYNEMGCRAIDNYDKDVSNRVVVSGYVDTSTAGSYYINYYVVDSSANKSTTLRRKIVVRYLPFESLAVKVKNERTSYEIDEVLTFEIDFGDINQNNYNVNADFEWYVDGVLYQKTNQTEMAIAFEDAGQHNVSVKVENKMLYDQVEILESSKAFVTINKAGILERYGIFVIAGGSSVIVLIVCLSFVIRRKRKLY